MTDLSVNACRECDTFDAVVAVARLQTRSWRQVSDGDCATINDIPEEKAVELSKLCCRHERYLQHA